MAQAVESWQAYLDEKFPDGAILIWDSDSDTGSIVMKGPRLWVVREGPVPEIWMSTPDSHGGAIRFQLLHWQYGNGVATFKSPAHSCVLSNHLTPADKKEIARQRDSRPPEELWQSSAS